jgi:hypothetical protein
MAKPDLFRILGCIVMVTLILVIAVKLSKQCMTRGKAVNSVSPHAKSASPRSLSATPGTQAQSECQSGYRVGQNGFCIEDY